MMRVDESYTGGKEVTPSDTVNVTFPSGTNCSRAVRVDVAGAISMEMIDGTTVVLANLLADYDHPYAVKRINSTGTTATGITVFY